MARALHTGGSGPLYEMVKRHITEGIGAGRFPPGSKLPSENDLVRKLSVSRMTVNRALRELSRDGVLYRMQGVGSFVCEAGPDTSLSEVRDIREIVAGRGAAYSCRVLNTGVVALDATRAELFDMVPGRQVSRLELLHFENGLPLQYERRFVRKDFAPDILEQDFSVQSLYAYLQRIAPISELEHVVEAGLADAAESRLLQLMPEQPVLRIRRRTWTGNRVVTLGFFSHPAERYRVAVRVRPRDVTG